MLHSQWVWGGNKTMSHNTNIMATYKNTIDTSTDVSGGNKSILINAAIQWP